MPPQERAWRVLVPVLLSAVASWIATAKTLSTKPNTTDTASVFKKEPMYARLYVNQSAQQRNASDACSAHAGMDWISKYTGKTRELCAAKSGSPSAFGCARLISDHSRSLLKRGPANVNDFAYAQLNLQEQKFAVAHAQDKILSDDYMCSGFDLLASAEEAVGPRDGQGKNFLVQFGVACQWGVDHAQLVEMYGHWVPLDFVQAEADACANAAEQVEGLTFLMYPLDFWNPYEGGHQLLNTFATAVALDIDMQNTRILWLTERMDSRGHARLKGLAEEVFSRAGPALLPSGLQKDGTCLKNAVVPIGGEQSLLMRSLNHNTTLWHACRNGAPILVGWGNYLLDAMQVERRHLNASDLHITILTRMPGSREFLNQDELQHAVEQNRSARRASAVRSLAMVTEEGNVDEEALTEKLVRTLSKAGRVVKAFRFDKMPIKEQLTVMQNTDLVISPHAAALAWMIVSPPCARVLEMSYGPRHYEMLSALMSIPHKFTGGTFFPETPAFRYGKKDMNNMAVLTDNAETAWRQCTGKVKMNVVRKEMRK